LSATEWGPMCVCVRRSGTIGILAASRRIALPATTRALHRHHGADRKEAQRECASTDEPQHGHVRYFGGISFCVSAIPRVASS
jgi:hypothetical protein